MEDEEAKSETAKGVTVLEVYYRKEARKHWGHEASWLTVGTGGDA